jgi:hypothetical protein
MTGGAKPNVIPQESLGPLLGKEYFGWLRAAPTEAPAGQGLSHWEKEILRGARRLPEPPKPSFVGDGLSADPKKAGFLRFLHKGSQEAWRSALACSVLAKALEDRFWMWNPELRQDLPSLGTNRWILAQSPWLAVPPEEKAALAGLYRKLGELYQAKATLLDSTLEAGSFYWASVVPSNSSLMPKPYFLVAKGKNGLELSNEEGRLLLRQAGPAYGPRPSSCKPAGWREEVGWRAKLLWTGISWDAKRFWENLERVTDPQRLGRTLTNPTARMTSFLFWCLYDFFASRSGNYRELDSGGLSHRGYVALLKTRYWENVQDLKRKLPYLSVQIKALEEAIRTSYPGAKEHFRGRVGDWFASTSACAPVRTQRKGKGR